MRTLTTSGLVVVLLATLVATVAPSPFGALGGAAAQDRHTFEVQLQGESPFELKAERLVHHPSGMVTLTSGEATVAAFSAYQIIYVVRTTTRADRTFEIKTNEGEIRRFPADRLTLDPSQMVRLQAGGELVGLVWNNNVRYVVAAEARP